MCDTISFWATVLSPIVGVIAIIVALVVAKNSSRDAQKQIKAIYNLLDVFVAAQNPNMMTALQHYQQQLAQLDEQIADAKMDMESCHHPFFGRGGAPIDDIIAIDETNERKRKYEELFHQRKEIEKRVKLIQAYLDNVTK